MLPWGRMTVAGVMVTALSALTPLAQAAPAQVPATLRGVDTVGGPDLAVAGVVVHRGQGSLPLPSIDADTWLVADLTTGEVLAAKGAHRRVLPASTLKTLTALTLMPKLDPASVITTTYDQARAVGGHVGVVPDATYSIRDLWYGLLLPSGNDAAAALADANGGMRTTVTDMMAAAAHLQALDTTVHNDSGLDHPKQFSSAYDMALFARAALAIPEFRKVTGSVRYAFPGRMSKPGKKRSTYMIYSQNRLLLHGYRGTVGGKTGFTTLAHRTFWGAATRRGHTLVVTLFQVHEPTETAARALLDWGFASLGHLTPVGQLVDPVSADAAAPTPGSTPVPGASTSASASAPATATSRFQVPWVPVGLALILIVGAALWWRRSRTRAPGALAAAEVPLAGSPPPAILPWGERGGSRASAALTPSVVLSTPGRPSVAGGTPEALDAPTGPLAPVEAPSPVAPVVDAPVAIVRPAPVAGGHVRVITPPSRDPAP